MKYMSSNEIRETFLKFFEDKQHRRVPSASLIPANDPTLLFTNAGMVPFKDCFLGAEKRDYVRATSSQRCVRAGGKHNDLDNVGYTARHHTFFEMLGNFSFGDYFKEEAIRFAWEFLTETLGLPKEKLWVTVFHDDQEAEDIWFNEIGIDQTRFSRLGEKDNFWAMGDTGPCGPCSEIFYDHGPEVDGGPPGSPEEDGDRYIEIWNLVFMQFNRHQDGTMEQLPKPAVDTGMGLERIAAVMQNVHSNYEIDLFSDLIKDIAKLLSVDDIDNKSLRVIADHIRSAAFLIIDGVVPSNEGRGYVLRRIMRRAIRHGHKLGATDSFFFKVAESLAGLMGKAYPELKDKLSIIQQTIVREEEQFARTLDNGMKILEQDLSSLKGDTVSGETVFTLYDTYGFPVDLTADIARERNLSIDEKGFNELMRQQRERSQAAGQFGKDYNATLNVEHSTEFVGYDSLENSNTILQLFKGEDSVTECNQGEEIVLVTDKTAFYAESGGQVGDRGEIITETGRAEVIDTNKINQAFAHRIKIVEGKISEGQSAQFKVDASLRSATAIHHSATHLIHAALREVLGEHVTQKGSLVDEFKLRFDFSHPEAVTPEELAQVERRVNEEVLKNHPVLAAVMSMDEAKEQGAMALFGEKYGDEVRVLTMGDFSVELCGGTHVTRTGDIGLFKILSEQGIASGIRRIEAVGGMVALRYVQEQEAMVRKIAAKLKAEPSALGDKVEALILKSKELEKNIEQLNGKLASSQGSELVNAALTVNGIKIIATELSGVDPKSLRDLLDQLKNKLQSGVVALGLNNDGKANLIVGVTQDLTKTLKAGDIVKEMAAHVGGKGGGRPDMAQAGGPDAGNIKLAIEAAVNFVTAKTS